MIFITIILTLFFIIRICSSAILIILGILLSKEIIKDYLEITMGEKITIYSISRAIIYIISNNCMAIINAYSVCVNNVYLKAKKVLNK